MYGNFAYFIISGGFDLLFHLFHLLDYVCFETYSRLVFVLMLRSLTNSTNSRQTRAAARWRGETHLAAETDPRSGNLETR